METIIDIIKNQKPMEVPKVSQQYSNGSAPGKGFGINNGEAYVGKIGKTIFTNGRGIKQYNKQEVYYINNFPCLIHSIHYDYLMRISVINNDLQLSEKYAVKIGDSIEISNNLHNAYKEAYWESLKTKDIQERIQAFIQEYPDTNKKITGYDFLKWHIVLTNSCLKDSYKFVHLFNIDLNKEYDILYALNIVKSATKDLDTIKTLIKYYNHE